MEVRKIRQELYVHRTQVVKALAHPLRLAIIDLLSAKEEICVCELVDILDCDQPSLSKHLAILKNAGVITSSRDGTRVMYQICTPYIIPCIKNFFYCIDRVLKTDLENKEQNLAALVLRADETENNLIQEDGCR
jgi:DNA-binding transcriptional ArsR family regulator